MIGSNIGSLVDRSGGVVHTVAGLLSPWSCWIMEAHLIKHSLRVGAGGIDRYSPEGWSPKLRLTVMGPTPPDVELVWTMYRTDGSIWFEHSVGMPTLEDEEMHDVSLQRWESGTDIDEDGAFRFTVRLVNELDGVDVLLHDGTMHVGRLEGDKRFAVDHSSLLTTGLVALDVYDEHDAPKVRATVFVGGQVDSYQVEAHMFLDGKRFAKSSYVQSGFEFTSNTGDTLATEWIAEFDTVRGWNNLRHQNWGQEDWHYLDLNPGAYEIKFTREGKVNRTMAFEVAGGRIVKDDLIEPDFAGRPTLWRTATSVGAFDGDTVADPAAPRGYGDMVTSLIDYSSDGMYWFRTADVVEEEAPYDEETTAAVESVVGKAQNLLHSWEEDMQAGHDRNDSMFSNFLLQCEVVVSDVDGWEAKYGALNGVADEHEFALFSGEALTLAAAAPRVLALRDLAKGHMGMATEAHESELAPYRALLANDKLAIFEDHPANSFRYYTVNKHVIETPEELAEASLWFFEGSADIQSKGTVDGMQVTASTAGWRVLGYAFDDNGVLIDEFETQGVGSSAPKSEFVGR